MVKQSNGQWIHISDTDDRNYAIKFDSHQQSIPYILFYTKSETIVNNQSLNTANSVLESESVNFNVHHDLKRTNDSSVDNSNGDNLNCLKKKKLETDHDCEKNVIVEKETLLNEIQLKREDIAKAKTEKLNLKLSTSELDSEDPSYSEEMKKLSDQLGIYNKIIENAKKVIALKNQTLKNMQEKKDDAMDVSETTETSEIKRNETIRELNRGNLLKELQAQSKKVSNAEELTKQKELLKSEIESKKKEIANAKKDKLSLKMKTLDLDCEDPSYSDRMKKLGDEITAYNQIIKNAQMEIIPKRKL